MSKKDILERLSRGSEPRPRRTAPEVGAPRATGDAVTTRVSKRVVRRTRRAKPRAEAPAKPAPAPEPVVAAEPTPPPVEAAVEAPPPEPAPEPTPEPTPEPAPAVEAAPEVVAEAAPAPEAEPAPKPEPAAPEPVEVAEAAEPAEQAKPAPEPTPEPTPEPAPVAAAPEANPTEAAASGRKGDALPDTPRFAGLGKAVVMPPPGYDPTNPGAYRQRMQQTPSPSTTPGTSRDKPGYGRRRRVDHTERAAPGRPARRGRRGRGAGGPPMRRKTRRKGGAPKAPSPPPKASKRIIRIDNVISVGQLAHELGLKASIVIRKLLDLDVMATVNEMLEPDVAAMVAAEFEYEVTNVGFQEEKILESEPADEDENQVSRPPVVTIMGHVDHGKTTLLDAIRTTSVAAGEAGGITQHIGAYQVEVNGEVITFIDTPGHAAFTEMRARGAGVTDIVVLVVAADDGVQAQTVEAISHARSAGVPIIVAVNKMDRPGASPDPIKQRLTEYELVAEEWGGDTLFVPVSALKGDGIQDLLESIVLQAEVLELKANPDRMATGVVVESKVVRGRGPVATVLVQRGTLNKGDNVVLGIVSGRVRAMLDHNGKRVNVAGPATPVEIFGLSKLPEAGDPMAVVKNEKDAKLLAEHRAEVVKQAAARSHRRRTAEDLFAQAAGQDKQILHVVLKADVQGSLEAVRGTLLGLSVEGAEIRILHAGVGDISESDVGLIAVNNGLLIGFNVRVDAKARRAAERQSVAPEIYKVIYDVIDRVQAVLRGLVAPTYEDVRQGAAEVRQVFNITKVGAIAGSYILDGKVARNNMVRLIRNNVTLWEGKLLTLKRFKDDVREVTSGYECGIGLDGYDQIEVGDIIECYTRQEVEQAG